MHLSSGLRLSIGDVLLIASALTAVIVAAGAVRRKILKPARAAFAHSIAEAARVVIVDELAPVKEQVADLHVRLSTHLTEETGEIAGIHTAVDGLGTEMRATFDRRSAEFAEGAAPWRSRFETLEGSHTEILARLDELGNQGATDTAKVIHAGATDTAKVIDAGATDTAKVIDAVHDSKPRRDSP